MQQSGEVTAQFRAWSTGNELEKSVHRCVKAAEKAVERQTDISECIGEDMNRFEWRLWSQSKAEFLPKRSCGWNVSILLRAISYLCSAQRLHVEQLFEIDVRALLRFQIYKSKAEVRPSTPDASNH